MMDIIHTPSISTWKTYGLWICQGLLALAFLAAGGQKLLSTDAMVALFSDIGLGQWFRWLTGLLEILAAILIVIPATAVFGAAMIISIMIGAIFTHVALIGGSAIPALVLGLMAVVVLIGRLRRP